jgi:hypothetical protein
MISAEKIYKEIVEMPTAERANMQGSEGILCLIPMNSKHSKRPGKWGDENKVSTI